MMFAMAVSAVGCGLQTPNGPGRSAAPTVTPPRDTTKPAAVVSSSPATEAPRPPDLPAISERPVADEAPDLRPDDNRPRHDDRALAARGIRVYESARLKLYTDIDPAVASTLPPIVDQAYAALTDYFGPLPETSKNEPYQLTGYLIRDESAFRAAGLIPFDLPPFEHGRHRDYEFWMREQQQDYYRRHLLIHEVTHCFMTIRPGTAAPVWYMEGMAENFGTHELQADGTVTFRVLPDSPARFAGWGRITAIRHDYAAGRARTISEVLEYRATDFLKTEPYAWSWALTKFLDAHPRYRERFRELRLHLLDNAFPTEFFRLFSPDDRALVTEWLLFIHGLQYGYDLEHAAMTICNGQRLNSTEVRIQADAGWQSSGFRVERGERYEITASGRVQLADQPKPWISEAQGISFHYSGGFPVGLLTGCIDAESPDETKSILNIVSIGPQASITAPVTGTLYLRINDDWNRLADNQGTYAVAIKTLSPESRSRPVDSSSSP